MSISARKTSTPAQLQAWTDWNVRIGLGKLYAQLHKLRYSESSLVTPAITSAIDAFYPDLLQFGGHVERSVRNVYLCPSCRKLATGRKTRSDHKHKRYARCPGCGTTNSIVFYTRIPDYRETWITQFHTDHPELLL